MVELHVPELVEDPFRKHYRALIVGSFLRAAEAESARHRALGHRIRARRAERTVERLRPPVAPVEPSEAQPPRAPIPDQPLPAAIVAPLPPLLRSLETDAWIGPRARRAAAVVWVATLAALLANIVFLGVDSYATAAADLGFVAMTFVWFFACIDDLLGPSR